MDNLRVILIPVTDRSDRTNGRKFAELIENQEITLHSLAEKDCMVFTLSDFMDLCNDQEIESLEGWWISYAKII
jgi:hypothetical protein